MKFSTQLGLLIVSLSVFADSMNSTYADSTEIGSNRQLMVEKRLIDHLTQCRQVLHEPKDEGPVLNFDAPWEGIHCGYCTMIRDGERFRVYYRGLPETGKDGGPSEVTCMAESTDGIHWTKPNLDLFEIKGSKTNNVVLANAAPFSHNFSPFLDSSPNCPPAQRYKALSGLDKTGLFAFTSEDGTHWSKLCEHEVIPRKAPFEFRWMFDSQNLAFWSASENKYVCYFRVYSGARRIARTESPDFVNWSEPVLMTYVTEGQECPIEELYTNQTAPYFRAPDLYVAIAARFVPGRQAISDEEAIQLKVAKEYHKDLSDAVVMTTRGGSVYDRTFLSSFIRPGIGAKNWVSRTNYPALGILQTGPTEMSIYTNQDYAQPTAHLHRYSLRMDGFASIHAEYQGGEFITKPIQFKGDHLDLNFSTSAVGSILVELQSDDHQPIAGFKAEDCIEVIGNELDRTVRWKSGATVNSLAGKSVRLRFILKDADLFAFRFSDSTPK